MKLHPRTKIVTQAENELGKYVNDWWSKHDLTYIEAAQCISRVLQMVLKYALRVERHPNEPEKNADEH